MTVLIYMLKTRSSHTFLSSCLYLNVGKSVKKFHDDKEFCYFENIPCNNICEKEIR